MKKRQKWKMALAGFIAGSINGLLGAGGGMILVPILTAIDQDENRVFSNSVAIILPICLISLAISPGYGALPWKDALPYLIASIPGAVIAGIATKKIPVKWLHRALGILILWGGVRYLC